MIDHQILLGILQEIIPVLPIGYSIKLLSATRATIHSNQFVLHGDAYCELPHINIVCDGQLVLTHTYYIPDDWPYRSDGYYMRDCRFEYADPDFIDEILTIVADVAADPHTRTNAWKPRKIGRKAREARRRGLVARIRCSGRAVPDDAPFATLKELLDEQTTIRHVR